ncbi:hypothetical protein, partial [Cupriavidus pinatubonensis]|uniref:hypothetical protein n=1 Tax=Cupriavidus pinatubonensis TaxID=248026 RepID=UPI003605CA05
YPISAEDESAVRLERFFLYASHNARCRTIATVCQGNLTAVKEKYNIDGLAAPRMVTLFNAGRECVNLPVLSNSRRV